MHSTENRAWTRSSVKRDALPGRGVHGFGDRGERGGAIGGVVAESLNVEEASVG